MNTKRTIDISVEFPDISGNNREILQNYYNDCIVPVSVDSTYHTYLVIFKKILSNIGVVNNKPIVDWNDDDCISILQACNARKTAITQLRALLHRIIKYAGGATSKAGYDIRKEYSSLIITFSDLNNRIQSNFFDKNTDIDWDEPNTWSTYIVIAYLLWLGFTKSEIAKLKTRDFNLSTNTIMYYRNEKPSVCVINESAIAEYLANYVNAKTCTTHIGGRKTECNYPDSDNLIKVENSSYENIENYARKFPKYFGLYADEILTAGRMARLFYLEKIKNISIEQSNLGIIRSYINFSLGKRTLESLISDYQSYRDKRQASKQSEIVN